MVNKLKYPNNSILSKLKEIIIDELEVKESEITFDASFINDLGATSIDTIGIITRCEQKFNIAIKDEFINKLNTVQSMLTHIEKCKDI